MNEQEEFLFRKLSVTLIDLYLAGWVPERCVATDEITFINARDKIPFEEVVVQRDGLTWTFREEES